MCDAAAEPASTTKETVDAFVRNCLSLLPDTKKVQTLAELEKWEDLPPEAAPLLAPADPKAIWKAWFIRSKKQFVGTTIATTESGDPAAGCTLVGISGSHKDAITWLLKYQTDLTQLDERTEAGQHVTIYTGSIMEYPLVLSVKGPLDGPGMILSAILVTK